MNTINLTESKTKTYELTKADVSNIVAGLINYSARLDEDIEKFESYAQDPEVDGDDCRAAIASIKSEIAVIKAVIDKFN